ncbi:MAG TPA: folylpolyglutamate synthase/dihydrofolate synthase family protein [Polyangiaceae bacterium]
MNGLAASLAELYSRVPRGIELGLDKMRAACTRFDSPEKRWPVIHVAGTNGKGSTCAIVESVARTAGKKTGLYTSPHLARFAERIRIGGEPIDDDTLARILADVLARAPELTFFEAATMTAFVAFAEAKVDLAVLEVGIGGRLDATNVIEKPLACGITSISFDHMDKLGNTLPEIAREKAGIAKKDVPLVIAQTIPAEARAAIEEVAAKVGAPVKIAQHTAMVNDSALLGAHQSSNADVALWLVHESEILKGRPNSQRDLMQGFAHVKWPGRLERIDTEDASILLDAAHNPAGVETLAAYLESSTTAPRTLVFGALADKDWKPMIDRLAPLFDNRVYTTPKGRAPTPPEEIAARHRGVVAKTPAEALGIARKAAGEEGLVVVAGSIFLVGEARSILLDLPTDPAVAL